MKGETKRLISTLILGVGMALVLLWSLGSSMATDAAPASAELHVCPTGCTYSSVQAAVDDANNGDVIKVALGVYNDIHQRAGITQIVYISKSVTLLGGYAIENWDLSDPEVNPTILDAEGQGRVVVIRGGAAPTIQGFILTGGAGYYSGGGINIAGSSPTIQGNQVVSNSATGDGGGIFINGGSAQILNNHVVGNSAWWAGGVRIINDADVTVEGNHIINNEAQISGGGVFVDCCGGSMPLVARNYIINNSAGTCGGGILVESTNARLINNIIAENPASSGTGICLIGAASYPVSTTLFHNTLVGGPAGGEGVWATAYVTSFVVNNIISAHSVGISNTAPASSTIIAGYTLFYANGTDYGDGVSSANEVHGDPDFANPAESNYHIGSSSVAIDSGTNVEVVNDIDGGPRPEGIGYDIGADEFSTPTYLPLVLRNLG